MESNIAESIYCYIWWENNGGVDMNWVLSERRWSFIDDEVWWRRLTITEHFWWTLSILKRTTILQHWTKLSQWFQKIESIEQVGNTNSSPTFSQSPGPDLMKLIYRAQFSLVGEEGVVLLLPKAFKTYHVDQSRLLRWYRCYPGAHPSQDFTLWSSTYTSDVTKNIVT